MTKFLIVLFTTLCAYWRNALVWMVRWFSESVSSAPRELTLTIIGGSKWLTSILHAAKLPLRAFMRNMSSALIQDAGFGLAPKREAMGFSRLPTEKGTHMRTAGPMSTLLGKFLRVKNWTICAELSTVSTQRILRRLRIWKTFDAGKLVVMAIIGKRLIALWGMNIRGAIYMFTQMVTKSVGHVCACMIACAVLESIVLGQIPAAVPLSLPEVQFLDSAGMPLYGSKLCTYQASSSTPLATYTDASGSTPNTNPIILDVYGRASVWVGPSLYKFVLRTGGDGTCTTGAVQWTQDNVSSWLGTVGPLLTLGSRLTMSIPGTLSVGTNLGPAAFYVTNTSVKQATVMVKETPVGGSGLVFVIKQGTTTLFSCTIAPAATLCSSTTSPQTVPANTPIVINITGVGTTFPGGDATVQLN